MHLNTTFHPLTNGHTERVNQVFEDMLRGSILDLKGSWEDHIGID